MKTKDREVQKDNLDEMLTVNDVMNHLKFSRQKVYLLTKDGELPAYKIGKSVRYKKADVLNLLRPVTNTAA